MALTPRHLHRYRQIAEVFVRHGFGATLTQLGLDRHLKLSQRLLRRGKSPAAAEMSLAEHVRLALEELGPAFIKFGQILSTRPDLIPPDYIAELSLLQDQVPSVDWDAIKSRIEAELGDSIEDLFAAFEQRPLAAASLAQVHAATLPDGQAVVVKVQRPHIGQTIDLDLDILYDLARLLRDRTPLGDVYNFIEIAEDFAATLRAEMDYRREGRNAERFRTNFSAESYLHVPRVYWEYSTRRVLTMERLSGVKIDDIEALDEAGYDRHQVALHAARAIIKEILEDGFFHADPHPGNFVIMPGEVIGVMDFGIVGHLEERDRADLTRLYMLGVRMDAAGIMEQLIQMGVADHRLNRTGLQRDLRRLLLKYAGLPLKEISAREVIKEIMPIAFRYHLRLPSDLWLLGKTLAMMEGMGLKLDPDFDIFAVSEPYVKRFIRQMWLPSTWGPSLLRGVNDWSDLLNNLPRQTAHILKRAEAGELGLHIKLTDLEKTTNRLDGIVNRLIFSILVAALIIALAMLTPPLNLAWPWGLLTWLSIGGFIILNMLGVWLLISILRSG